mmetsp:Transcript_25280/g.22286  ORF Transcript_25280/g.22286 Transcript_25280/m.22286 type:complete len:135 (-) Transcript_25280:339-743(-)
MATLLHGLGKTYWKKGSHKEAMEKMEKSLQTYNKKLKPIDLKEVMFESDKMGAPTKILNNFSFVFSMPSKGYLLFDIGMFLLELGKDEEAKRNIEDAFIVSKKELIGREGSLRVTIEYFIKEIQSLYSRYPKIK